MIIHEIKYSEYKKALDRLKVSLALPKNDIVRDSVIQRFEFTVELAWKTLARILKEGGVSQLPPKNVFREAAKLGYIHHPEEWIQFVDDRNLSSHTYREDLAEKVYESATRLPKYADELLKFFEKKLGK